MSRLKSCPRCGERSLEKLQTYSHCSHCLYYEDYWREPDEGYRQALQISRELTTIEQSMSSSEIETEINVQPQTQELKGA